MSNVWAGVLFCSLFLLELAIGALMILSFHRTVSGRWLDFVEPRLLRIVRIFYFIPVLFLILFFARSSLYSENPSEFGKIYFSPLFLGLRNILYFAIWAALVSRFRDGKQTSGAVPMILILLTTTFVSVDWLLALNLHWRSTAFGVVFLASSLLSAHALTLSTIKDSPDKHVLRDLNTIHFTLIGAWSYLVFMQYLIIWSGNLPEEATMYVSHGQTKLQTLPLLLMFFQFAFSLFALLFRRVKTSYVLTRALGYSTLLWQGVYIFWIIERGRA